MNESTGPVTGGPWRDPLDAVFACLADSHRRSIVGLVSARAPASLPREDLAPAFASWTTGKPRRELTAAERQQAEVTLAHVHLPMLSAAGLLERGSDGNSISLGDHPALTDAGVVEAIEGDGPTSATSLDSLFRAIASERNRTILDVLSHQFGPIHLETLAREIVSEDRETRASDVPSADIQAELGHLYQVDLPHLSDAGLVRYDVEEGTVAYEGHPHLRVPWMHSTFEPEFRQRLTGESDTNGIGEIQSRERIVSFGQSLCERAEDELFCMFTDTDLLEAGCLTRIRDASHRGADVYLGTRDPVVRDYVQEHAPEVILWEPNTDWLNLPVAGDKVGRLLLADREAVMLGTLLEQKNEGFHEEQAIIGEGDHNTLVTMICQLLVPHLEEIDKDTEDIELRLPL